MHPLQDRWEIHVHYIRLLPQARTTVWTQFRQASGSRHLLHLLQHVLLSLNLQLTVACTPAALLDTGSRAAPSYSTGSSCIGPGQAGYGPELKRFILLFSSLMVRARIKRRVPERSSCFANRKELVFFFYGFYRESIT
jgi:hypothetical protein